MIEPTWCTADHRDGADGVRPDGSEVVIHSRTIGDTAGALVAITAHDDGAPWIDAWGGERMAAAEAREVAALVLAAAGELERITK
ncbi:hypothetical protein [Rugosimonospora africana]|uniref:Uncharacterized protein n=1 Tax=Rugosimonospora africana TaxID=556532 RepID=A0A8J3QST6_9ACTN|nr:hypothetical protein [Rugosimonospora africana]GIH16249.1 hypothetical protein Raf01_44210 [Rugosimonospora africana]